MAFNRLQQIGKAAEHMGTDRFPLIRPGHCNNLVGGNAEMIRPEPNQPLDKADLGIGGGVESRFCLVQQKLLRQRRLSRLLRRGTRATGIGHARRCVASGCLILRALGQYLLGAALGLKVRYRARRFGARQQIDFELTDGRPIELGLQRATRIGGDGVDLIAQWSKAESMQSERRRLLT